MSEPKAYSPAEFSALFSRERTWTYRLISSGKISTITDYGRMLIPASEADRIAADVSSFKGRKKGKGSEKPKDPEPPAKGSSAWAKWVESRKSNSPKKKGMA